MRQLILSALAVLMVSCGDDGGPTGLPTNNVPNGTFAAFVNGVVYSPVAAGVNMSGSTISISTAGNGFSLFFTVTGTTTGTYHLTANPHAHEAQFTGPGVMGWVAKYGQGGTGTVTISSILAGRIQGTFNFEMVPVISSGASGNKSITSGTFNLSFAQ